MPAVCLPLALLICGAFVLCRELPGQAPPDAGSVRPAAGDFRSYAVRHVPAERVRDELTAMLHSLPEPGEVIADGQTNRLFVRGGESQRGRATRRRPKARVS